MIELKQSVPPSQVTSGKPSASSGREQKERPASGARIGGFLLVTLALLAASALFATDLYQPAFPAMVDDLGTGSIGVQLSLTAFLVGVGVGQVMFGPLSDRIGRRGLLWIVAAIGALALVAAALDQVRGASGMASAALGLLQFTFAGLAAPLVTLGGAGVIPLAATMLTASVVANVAFVIGRRPAPDPVPRTVPATPEPVLAEAVA